MSCTLFSPDNVPVCRDSDIFLKIPEREERTCFQVCISNPFPNCEKIAPRQQKKTAAFLDVLRRDENVQKVTVFGSSVTEQSHIGSDLDLYVVLNQDRRILLPAFNFPFDLWTNFSVDENMYREIQKKGVVVYERDVS